MNDMYEFTDEYMTLGKKYELTNECVTIDDKYTLYRIRALRDFADVKKGDLGGFIENEKCLSHLGNCWVYDQAMVYNHSTVSDDAVVQNNAEVFASSTVQNNAVVKDNAKVFRCCDIKDDSVIGGKAILTESVDCFVDAHISGDLYLFGVKKIYGKYVKHIDRAQNTTATYFLLDNQLVKEDDLGYFI